MSTVDLTGEFNVSASGDAADGSIAVNAITTVRRNPGAALVAYPFVSLLRFHLLTIV